MDKSDKRNLQLKTNGQRVGELRYRDVRFGFYRFGVYRLREEIRQRSIMCGSRSTPGVPVRV